MGANGEVPSPREIRDHLLGQGASLDEAEDLVGLVTQGIAKAVWRDGEIYFSITERGIELSDAMKAQGLFGDK